MRKEEQGLHLINYYCSLRLTHEANIMPDKIQSCEIIRILYITAFNHT